MDFFFMLFVIGIIVVVSIRMNQLNRQVATIHCLKHSWRYDENNQIYCEVCKCRPE